MGRRCVTPANDGVEEVDEEIRLLVRTARLELLARDSGQTSCDILIPANHPSPWTSQASSLAVILRLFVTPSSRLLCDCVIVIVTPSSS